MMTMPTCHVDKRCLWEATALLTEPAIATATLKMRSAFAVVTALLTRIWTAFATTKTIVVKSMHAAGNVRIPEGECDCEGNVEDAVGECGGDCFSRQHRHLHRSHHVRLLGFLACNYDAMANTDSGLCELPDECDDMDDMTFNDVLNDSWCVCRDVDCVGLFGLNRLQLRHGCQHGQRPLCIPR